MLRWALVLPIPFISLFNAAAQTIPIFGPTSDFARLDLSTHGTSVSYDREFKNESGFYGACTNVADIHCPNCNWSYTCQNCTPGGSEGFVLMHTKAPTRLGYFFKTTYQDSMQLDLPNPAIDPYINPNYEIAMTLDGAPEYNNLMSDYFNGNSYPFLAPFVTFENAARISYYPLIAQQEMLITTPSTLDAPIDGVSRNCDGPRFFAFYYQTFPLGSTLSTPDYAALEQTLNKEVGSAPHQFPLNWGAQNILEIPPGQTIDFINESGEGVVTGIRIKLSDPEQFNNIQIIGDVDGEKNVIDVELPFYFGTSIFTDSVDSLFFSWQPTTATGTNFFLAPHQNSIRFALRNTGNIPAYVFIEYAHLDGQLPGTDFGRLYVRSNQNTPDTSGKDYLYFEEKGAGKVAAVVSEVQTNNLNNLPQPSDALYEGDFHSIPDCYKRFNPETNSPLPDTSCNLAHDTATEVFYGFAWFYGPPDSKFSRPLVGYSGVIPGPLNQSGVPEYFKRTQYRIFFTEQLTYQAQIRTGHQVGPFSTIPAGLAKYKSATFAYHTPARAMTLTDSINFGDLASETDHLLSFSTAPQSTTHTGAYMANLVEGKLVNFTDTGYQLNPGEELNFKVKLPLSYSNNSAAKFVIRTSIENASMKELDVYMKAPNQSNYTKIGPAYYSDHNSFFTFGDLELSFMKELLPLSDEFDVKLISTSSSISVFQFDAFALKDPSKNDFRVRHFGTSNEKLGDAPLIIDVADGIPNNNQAITLGCSGVQSGEPIVICLGLNKNESLPSIPGGALWNIAPQICSTFPSNDQGTLKVAIPTFSGLSNIDLYLQCFAKSSQGSIKNSEGLRIRFF